MRHWVVVAALLTARVVAAADEWPQFRGPDGQGRAAARGLPLTWSDTENVVWKLPLPGRGWSSPVISGNRIWMTTADDEGHSLRALCVDRATGKLVYDGDVFRPETPVELNAKNSHASPTPLVEGNRVWVHFGTMGTACLDGETGNILWRSEALKLDHKEGPGSSPILFEELFIVHCDGQDVQYIAALDKNSGELVWKTDRTGAKNPNGDFRKAYATPLVVEVDGRPELVSTGADRVYGYDPRTGEELWWIDYQGFSNVPRPIAGNGLVYICTGYMKPQLWAIRPGGRGDVTATHVVWKRPDMVPANSSPILLGNRIYMASDRGVASCVDAATGEEIAKTRVGGNYSASPIAADGRIYFASEQGATTVIADDGAMTILAVNEFPNQLLMASPAAVGKELYLRSDTHLYRLEDGVGAK